MYIGKLGDGSSLDDGIYVLLKEVMDNAVDEYMMGYGTQDRREHQRQGGKGPRLRPRHTSWQGARCHLKNEYRGQI
ncbi:MAG: hypothetical protein MZV63_52035 [Marinilabiliales bacterium]|nr:hypothetical protein [Marinilabiliales bacterium]